MHLRHSSVASTAAVPKQPNGDGFGSGPNSGAPADVAQNQPTSDSSQTRSKGMIKVKRIREKMCACPLFGLCQCRVGVETTTDKWYPPFTLTTMHISLLDCRLTSYNQCWVPFGHYGSRVLFICSNNYTHTFLLNC